MNPLISPTQVFDYFKQFRDSSEFSLARILTEPDEREMLEETVGEHLLMIPKDIPVAQLLSQQTLDTSVPHNGFTYQELIFQTEFNPDWKMPLYVVSPGKPNGKIIICLRQGQCYQQFLTGINKK